MKRHIPFRYHTIPGKVVNSLHAICAANESLTVHENGEPTYSPPCNTHAALNDEEMSRAPHGKNDSPHQLTGAGDSIVGGGKAKTAEVHDAGPLVMPRGRECLP
jgi:hypothetical protein